MSMPNVTAPWWLRLPFIIIGVALWIWSQHEIGKRTPVLASEPIGDVALDILKGSNDYLHDNSVAADALLICSTVVIDALAVFLLAVSVFGKTLRPFVGLLLLFGMRQICQLLCALPAPPGIIWRSPGMPSLLVTYDVANDFFFSGHTGLAVLGAVELSRLGSRRWLLLAVPIAVLESIAVLILRAHYTMDVFTGAIAALYATTLSAQWAPALDRWLARLSGRDTALAVTQESRE